MQIKTYQARGTGYYISNSTIEGGYYDRMGNPLFVIPQHIVLLQDSTKRCYYTLQNFLRGLVPYVACAMDVEAFPYGTCLHIPELEEKYHCPITFMVVDTGGDFIGTVTSRIDIYTSNKTASEDETINGPLTLVHVVSGADTSTLENIKAVKNLSHYKRRRK